MDTSAFLTMLVSIAAIQFVGWAIPGPNHLAIVTASVNGGRRAGLAAGLGIAAGAFTWALLAVSGLALVFELFPSLFFAIRFAGAGYLIYLGINAFGSVKSGGMLRISASATGKAPKAPFLTAYTVGMTNPKAVLFFGSILTAFIPKDGSILLMGAVVAEVGILSAVLNTIAALFFSLPAVVRGFQAAGKASAALFGTLFCLLGGLVAYETAIELIGG